MLKKNTLWIVVVGLAVMALLLGSHTLGLDAARPHFATSTVSLRRADGQSVTYEIEVARTNDEQEYGLMFVRHLADDAGMIFPYDPPREVAFWMKNTYIPLDMVFIGADHRIVHIATHTRPLDVMPITSGFPVSAVLEINAGQSEKNHLSVGDKVNYTIPPL